MFKDICILTKIQTIAYHPENNGALERSHRILAEYLRYYIHEDQINWDEWIGDYLQHDTAYCDGLYAVRTTVRAPSKPTYGTDGTAETILHV
ncbi:hypothetical protein P5V15_002782 [Pogonomyrmex californicus]